MTRKDYELIAAAIRDQLQVCREMAVSDEILDAYERTLRGTACTLTERLAADNPRFDKARFLRACGVQS